MSIAKSNQRLTKCNIGDLACCRLFLKPIRLAAYTTESCPLALKNAHHLKRYSAIELINISCIDIILQRPALFF